MSKVKMEIKLTKKKILFVTIFSLAFVLLYLGYIYIVKQLEPIYVVNYNGILVEFREDIKQAEKIPVYPDETAVKDTLMIPLVQNITIAFVPTEENGIYIVEEIELITKLTIAHGKIIGIIPKFKAVNVTNYENLSGTAEYPIIALVHPRLANETSVKVSNRVVTISGKNLKELDYAVIKVLLISLGIDVNKLY